MVRQNLIFYFVELFHFDEFGDSLYQDWTADKIRGKQSQALLLSL